MLLWMKTLLTLLWTMLGLFLFITIFLEGTPWEIYITYFSFKSLSLFRACISAGSVFKIFVWMYKTNPSFIKFSNLVNVVNTVKVCDSPRPIRHQPPPLGTYALPQICPIKKLTTKPDKPIEHAYKVSMDKSPWISLPGY